MIKIRTGTMLYPKTINLADSNLTKANASSRNEFIEKAINFYVGYLNSKENIGYVNEIIEKTIESKINVMEKSISSLLFKFSVELNMIMNILALHFEIENQVLESLRDKSIKQVQETIGRVNLDDVFKEFREKEE